MLKALGHTRLRHPCLARSSRCIEPLYPHHHRKIATIPLPRTKLASPRKRGGGLTALQNRYSTSSSFCNLPDCFQNCYTFCRQDGGDCVCLEDLKIVLLSISIPTVTARNSFRIVKAGLSEYCTASQKKLSAVPPPLSKVRCCRPKKFGRLPEGLPHHHPSLAPTLPKPHYPSRFS